VTEATKVRQTVGHLGRFRKPSLRCSKGFENAYRFDDRFVAECLVQFIVGYDSPHAAATALL
jgi:hypothetical protein